jgi:hypothetical protein
MGLIRSRDRLDRVTLEAGSKKTLALACRSGAGGKRVATRIETLKPTALVPFEEVINKGRAVMDDRQQDEARKPQPPRYVTERQLHRVLDESLWQIERRRVDPAEPADTSLRELV